MMTELDEESGDEALCGDLFAPFPYYGNKRKAAPLLWARFGDVPNYVTACGGALGELLARPSDHHPKIETANDASGQICNVWRSIQLSPRATAKAADWIVSELDLHGRHRVLVERVNRRFVERLRADPTFHDPELAGWWIWGAALWIGAGWCAPPGGREGNPSTQKKRPATGGQGGRPHLGRGVQHERLARKIPVLIGYGGQPKLGVGVHAGEFALPSGPSHQLPHLVGSDGSGVGYGRGVNSTSMGKAPQRLPHLRGPANPARADGTSTGVGYGRGIYSSEIREDILGFFELLSRRLRRVRIVCGDAFRVLTPAVTTSHGITAVLLDPPYGEEAERCSDLYACDSLDLAPKLRAWALAHENDPNLRIALCGYEGEHKMPATWECVKWKSSGASKNADRERIWFSPSCLRPAPPKSPSSEQLALGFT